MEKTCKVNVVMFEDCENGWMVAINLPKVDPPLTKIVYPTEAIGIAMVLAEQQTASEASRTCLRPRRFLELVSFVKRNIDEVVWPELARQLGNFGMLANISNDQLSVSNRVELSVGSTKTRMYQP